MADFQFIPYTYEPLPTPTSIRLLSRRYDPPSDSPPLLLGTPLLQLSLDTVDLADDPTYEALSYTWGAPFPEGSREAKKYDNPNNKWPILVNNQLFLIGENLFDALCRLFPDEKGEEERYGPFNKTRLIQAAEQGLVEEVMGLLSGGADVTAQDVFGETALHYAAENGHFKIVEALVDAGSDLHKVDSHGRTPLLCATDGNQPIIIEDREFAAFIIETHLKKKYGEEGCDLLSDGDGLMRPYQTLPKPILEYVRSFASEYTDIPGPELSRSSSSNQEVSNLSASDRDSTEPSEQGATSMPTSEQEECSGSPSSQKSSSRRSSSTPKHTIHMRLVSATGGDKVKHIGILLDEHSLRLLLSPHKEPLSEDPYSYIKIIDFLLRRESVPMPRTNFAAQKRSKNAISLWADFICINQSNVRERNAQVAIMFRIYSQATRVVVWLGPEDPSSRIALDLLYRGHFSRYCGDDVSETISKWTYSILQKEFTQGDVAKEDASSSDLEVQALRFFLQRRWFQRVWVIQELALAREVRMLCGACEFSYGMIHYILQALFIWREGSEQQKRPLALQLEELKDTGFDGTHAYTLTDIQTRINPEKKIYEWMEEEGIQPAPTWGKRLSLPVLVSMTMAFRANDPRDKIYALLGIAREDPNCMIIADYAKPAEELFVSFAHYFMAGSPDEPIQYHQTGECKMFEVLEGLSYIQRRPTWNTKLKLPSWVPDFGEPLAVSRLWALKFNAGGDVSSAQILPASDPRILHLQGFRLAKVSYVEKKKYSTDEELISLHEIIRLLKQLDPIYSATGEQRAEALWRTWIVNRRLVDLTTPCHDDRMGFWGILAGWYFAAPPLDQKTIDDYNEIQATDQSDSLPSIQECEEMRQGHIRRDWSDRKEQMAAFSRNGRRYSTVRSFFVTEEGHIGLGPLSTRRGDEVWIIPGVRTPLILGQMSRGSTPIRRQFVGEAYVHGVMEGNSMRAHEKELSSVFLV